MHRRRCCGCNISSVNVGECSIKVSKLEKTDESTRSKAECFYCFQVFGNPDETRSPSLLNGFSKGGPNLLTINPKTVVSLSHVHSSSVSQCGKESYCDFFTTSAL